MEPVIPSTESSPPSLTPQALAPLLKHVDPADIPLNEEILSAAQLETRLNARDAPPYSVILLGDILLGDRADGVIESWGDDYPFAALRPLLKRSMCVVGNLEAPLTTATFPSSFPMYRLLCRIDDSITVYMS